MLDLKALPHWEGLGLSHQQIHLEPLDTGLNSSELLERWRSLQSDFPIVIILAPSDEIPLEMLKHFRFCLGYSPRSSIEWSVEHATLYWEKLRFEAPNLGQALLNAHAYHSQSAKGKHPWFWALSKCLVAGFIGLFLPAIQHHHIQLSKETPLKVLKTDQGKPLSEVEISAKSNFELRKKARKAFFQLGYFSEDPSYLQSFLDQKLRGLGYEQGFNPTKDQSYHPTAYVKIIPKEIKLKALAESQWQAYRFFSSLVLDSLAYPTDYWWQGNPAVHRIHDGVDIAGPQGIRLLAPFDGKLLSWKNDRAGNVAAVVHGAWIFYFAHCDQILFFDGDSIRAGEAIATIGMTGHTYGPHAHIGVGKLPGKYLGGHPSYTPMNPVEWYVNNRENLKLP